MIEKVLFVVYRTEWWGCFDSLCRMENCKDNVQCYVMPVPHYKREKHTFRLIMPKEYLKREELEEQIPEGVRILESHSFTENGKYSRIYIHNPYDGENPLDSVDEEFYSYRLKKYAEKLIYVPHLLFLNSIPETYRNSAVYHYVDTILLSDDRAKYSLNIEYDKKVEVVSCGIEDYLKRLSDNKKDCSCRGKKKLLYCISFNDLYYGTEKQIKKMWDIFQYIETRNDVDIMFCPDEDICARYIELDEDLVEKYEELLAYFRNNGIGTYIDNVNPYKAAIDADGIMSCKHVMNNMFLTLGKAVLNVDRESRINPTNDDRCIPLIRAVTLVDESELTELWFVPEKTKLICQMVIPDGKIKIVSEVPDEIAGKLNYSDIVKVGEYIYLAPLESNGIWKYDLKNDKYTKFYLPESIPNNLSRIIEHDKHLYFIPRCYPGIIKLNIENDEMVIINDWVSEFEKLMPDENSDEPYFLWAIIKEDNMLYMASSKSDIWMEFDLNTDNWNVRKMNIPKHRFINMIKNENDVWLLPYCGNEIIKWNCISEDYKEIYETAMYETRNLPYAFAIDFDSEIVGFPLRENNLLHIDSTNAFVSDDLLPCKAEDYSSEYWKQKKGGYQYCGKRKDGKVIVYECYDGAFLVLEKNLKICEKYKCRLQLATVLEQQDVIWKMEHSRSKFRTVFHEGYSFPTMIDSFIRFIESDESANFYTHSK